MTYSHKMPVILACGYNYSENKDKSLQNQEEALQTMRQENDAELKKGRVFSNYYFKRILSEENAFDYTSLDGFLKHATPIAGVPSFIREMEIMLQDEYSVGDVVIVGPKWMEDAVSAFNEYNAEEIKSKNMSFGYSHEGNEKSLSNTIRSGYLYLHNHDLIREDESVLYLPGDLPYFNSFKEYRNLWKKSENTLSVIPVNSLENIFDVNLDERKLFLNGLHPTVFPRYFHWGIKNDLIKEPNAFIINYNKLKGSNIINDIFASRKSSNGGLNAFIAKLAKENYSGIGKAILDLSIKSPKEFVSFVNTTAKWLFDKYSEKYSGKGKQVKFPLKKLNFDLKTISSAFTNLVDERVVLTKSPKHPGVIEDLDSIQDWYILESLHKAHPEVDTLRMKINSDDYKSFIQSLNSVIPKLENFDEFINWQLNACNRDGIKSIEDNIKNDTHPFGYTNKQFQDLAKLHLRN